jgi:hypothetical protein
VCLPGQQTREPFTDFRKLIDNLPPDEQAKVVGVANYKLFKAGVVPWEAITSRYRVRDLREVVATRKLTVKEMTGAGVKQRWADLAWSSVHTPVHELLEQQRRKLIANLAAAGLARHQIAGLAAQGIAARVQISSGPSGPSGPIGPGIDWGPRGPLAAFLAMAAAQQAAAAKQAKLKPAAEPTPASPDQPAADTASLERADDWDEED